MPRINDALQRIDTLGSSEKISYCKIAKDARCDRSTLSRRHRGVQVDVTTKNVRQRKVTPQQEDDLVQYTIGLTERHFPPTREMIKNFVRGLAHVEVSETWVTHFLQRHRDVLSNRWTSPMAADRHAADSWGKCKAYFDLLTHQINKYSVEPRHTYNMDEKGFMAGVIGKQKRVFSKASFKPLPPSLIFQADSANVQSNWVSDIDKKKHSVYTTVSPSGWSNDDAGLGWVEQVFNPLTKDKARRKWRLLT
ncbi:hypothetical protein PTT_04460 [Pyrenophora teres f. teres 0-1]|uniref:HTH CENPB-type domain-containing protein n=1 Tax=Pyrenophora teres f. teres (strain 0-1) TaxID=861557 RepID=E3REI3_PYRTT|nr:hypothetical protein PTT_04460 [Pyrenophora teres f. teres 0-1]